jgi:hypothetical protein
MDRIQRWTAAVAVLAILALGLGAIPAQAAGPRHEAARADGLPRLADWWSLGTRLLGWLDALVDAPGDAPAEPGLTRVSAASGVGMDPDGSPTAASGVGMDPDGSPTATSGGGMDPNG